MKISPVIITLVACVAFSGCGSKSEENSTSGSNTATPAATGSSPMVPGSATPTASPAPVTTAAVAAREVQKVAVVAAKEIAPELRTQAAEAFAHLGQQLVAATRNGESDALLKRIGADLETRVGRLAQSLADNEAVTTQLKSGVQALLGNRDVDAVAALNQLVAARLTPEQTSLAKEVYQASAAFATQRNFASLQGSGTEVGQLVDAVWKGDYAQALGPLQKVYGKATLTSAQKQLLATTFDPYLPKGWKEAAGALQQGVEQFNKLKF